LKVVELESCRIRNQTAKTVDCVNNQPFIQPAITGQRCLTMNKTIISGCLRTDRIQKAIALIEQGKIFKQAEGVYRVFTDRQNVPYTVTAESCDCEDKAAICKHRWAAIAGDAAILIQAIRECQSIGDLENLGKAYAHGLKSLPEVFVKIARSEYRMKCNTFASRNDEANAVLVKPQPKSNGHVNGIEI
jgi:hypothetical protein